MRLLLLILMISSEATAQNFEAPQLEFVCELKVTTDQAMTVGETAHGTRRIIPITGGTFGGPNIKGIVLNGGADYQFANKDNDRTEVEAIYCIKTDDSITIHIRNTGIVYQTEEAKEQLSKGGSLDWNKMYFRTALKFEAPINSRYNWMNNAVFICQGVPVNGYVSIRVWKVN